MLKRTPTSVIKLILGRGAGGHAPRMSLVETPIQPSLLHGELTSSERIGFWLYVAMGVFCSAILVVAAASAILA